METGYRRLLDSLNYFGTVNNFVVEQEYGSPPHYEIDLTPYDLNPYSLMPRQTITWNTSPDARPIRCDIPKATISLDDFEKLNKTVEEINENLTKGYIDYIDTDIAATREAFKNYILEGKKMPTGGYSSLFSNDIKFVSTGSWNIVPKVKKIIHSGPCTIVFWEDNTKTVVRLEEGKEYDEYAAFTAALAKKCYGSNSKVHKILEKKTVEQKQKSKMEKKEC